MNSDSNNLVRGSTVSGNMDLVFNCKFKGYIEFIQYSCHLFCELALSPRRGNTVYYDFSNSVYYDFSNFKCAGMNSLRQIVEKYSKPRDPDEEEYPYKHTFEEIKKNCKLYYLKCTDEEIDAILKKRTVINIHQVNKTGELIYVLNNVVYSEHFPLEWALNPKTFKSEHTDKSIIYVCGPGTSEHHCYICNKSGSLGGVFIGYCPPCANYIYKITRGYGFIDHGIELIKSEEGKLSDPCGNQYENPFEDVDINDCKSASETYLSGVNLDDIGYTNMDICLSGGPVPTGPDICDDQSDIDPVYEDKYDVFNDNVKVIRPSKRHPRRAYGIPEFIMTELLNIEQTDRITPEFIRHKVETFFTANGIEVTDNNYSFPIGPRASWDHYRIEKRPHYWYAWNANLKSENESEEDVEIRMRLYLSNPNTKDTPATMILECNNTKGRNQAYHTMKSTLTDWILGAIETPDMLLSDNYCDVIKENYEAEEEMNDSSNRVDGGLAVLIAWCFILYFTIIYHMNV